MEKFYQNNYRRMLNLYLRQILITGDIGVVCLLLGIVLGFVIGLVVGRH